MKLWQIREKIRTAYSYHRVRCYKDGREPMKRAEWEDYNADIIETFLQRENKQRINK